VTRQPRTRLRLEGLEERTLLANSTLQLVSTLQSTVSAPGVAAAQGASSGAQVSADGRFVVYQSSATDLVAGQGTLTAPNTTGNIFLLDRATGTTTLVSHATSSPTTTGDASSDSPILSSDGSTVAFHSGAHNLVAGGSSSGSVFVWHRATNTIDGLPEDNPRAISGDGRYILLASLHRYLYDQVTHTETLIDHTATSTSTASAGSLGNGDIGSLSDDGNLVTFTSNGSDLVPGQAVSPGFNVFLYNRATNTNTLVSGVSSSRTAGAGGCSAPVLSHDDSVVVFVSTAPNLVPGQAGPAGFNVFLYNRSSGATRLVSHASDSPTVGANAASGTAVVSGDGHFIAFSSDATNLVPGQTGSTGNFFLYDVAQGTATLVTGIDGSGTDAAGGAGGGINPGVNPGVMDLSDDGRLLAYQASAPNLVSGQTGPAATADVFLYDRPTGRTVLVSGAQGSPSVTGNFDSTNPRISGQGTYIVFAGLATNLDPNASITNGEINVFGRAPSSPSATLVSFSATPSAGTGASSTVTSTSADGRFAVFTSTATNVVPGQLDTNFGPDVFLFDKQTRTNTLVSHVPDSATTTGDLGLFSGQYPNRPAISADGNFVVFTSLARNLVPGQVNTPVGVFLIGSNVFLYNRQTGVITLVSHAAGAPSVTGDGYSWSPVVSADGHFVAYFSDAQNLVPAGSPGGDVYLFDAWAGTTTAVSHVSGSDTPSVGGTAGFDRTAVLPDSVTPISSISDDGRFIAYAFGSNGLLPLTLVPGQRDFSSSDIYLYDRMTGTNVLVSHTAGSGSTGGNGASYAPALSTDGNLVAFASDATDLVANQNPTGASRNVFLYSRATGAVALVSGSNGSPTTPGNGRSDSPAINQDGSYVAFRSEATNLVPGQVGGSSSNTFEYSLPTGTLTLVSHTAGSAVTPANGDSSNPVIDADGSLVAYESKGTNLVPGQTGTPGVTNLFVWDRITGNNVLASGQNGSYTVGGNGSSFGPVLSRHSFPYFSSSATDLVAGAIGAINAFINLIVQVQVTLPAVTLPDGAAPGSVVGAFAIAITQGPVGQLRLPTLAFGAGGGDNGAFSLTQPTATAQAALVLQVPVHRAVKGSYSIVVTVDLGLGDLFVVPFVLPVGGPSPPPPPPPRPGASTIGAFDPGSATWYLRNSDTPGAPDFPAFTYGVPGWRGVVGDWNGDGVTTVGIFDPSAARFYLRNANSSGAPDAGAFAYGAAGWIPLAGDWAGSGKDTVGVFDPGTATWYLRNSNSAGAPDAGQFQYGVPGWVPVVGKWDGKTTGIGVVDPASGRWYLRRTATPGAPDFATFPYGLAGWRPVVGDWGGTGQAGVGMFDPASSTWYLRDGASPGAPDHTPFSYGVGTWQPLGGAWIKAGTPQRSVVAGTGDGVEALRAEQLAPVVASALVLLQQAGVSGERLATADFQVANLPRSLLAETVGSLVTVDATAQGLGWFTAPKEVTPAGRYDLLTVVLHELGNVAGMVEVAGSGWDADLLAELLAPSVRRTEHLDAVFSRLS
jgi:hypothetical protein